MISVDERFILTIGGRQALPVRALLFITFNGVLMPGSIACQLSGQGHFPHDYMNHLRAYSYRQGVVCEFQPLQWQEIELSIKAAYERLKGECLEDAVFDVEFEKQGLHLLPEGVFVWFDEFSSAFARGRSRKYFTPEHEAERGLIAASLKSDDQLIDVMKGFTDETRSGSKNQKELLSNCMASKRKVGWKQALIEAWPRICVHYGREPTAKEVICWLKTYDISGVIVSGGEPTELKWRPQRTSSQSKVAVLKTVENAVSKLRQEGVLQYASPD